MRAGLLRPDHRGRDLCPSVESPPGRASVRLPGRRRSGPAAAIGVWRFLGGPELDGERPCKSGEALGIRRTLGRRVGCALDLLKMTAACACSNASLRFYS